jgi:hypothetical protein
MTILCKFNGFHAQIYQLKNKSCMSKENIPGIFNYCDRWCERCPFTSRCAVFESEKSATPEQLDMKNRAFWDRLSQNFAKARVMLEEAAEKSGIDMHTLRQEIEKNEQTSKTREHNVHNHPIVLMAKDYVDFADHWLKTQPGMMDKLEKLKENLTMGVESHEQAKEQTETIKESLKVIEWYMYFLEPKIARAIMGKKNADAFDEDDDYQRDYDGSAKITVVAVERSMHAWAGLFELLPEQEDVFLKVLALLEKIKAKIIEEFPNAMKFIRPGFDEPSEN